MTEQSTARYMVSQPCLKVYNMIGKGTTVHPSAIIYEDCIIGKNCNIQENVVIGGVGTELYRDNRKCIHRKEFKGKVVIGDNVDIGTGTIIMRGVEIDTTIANDTFIGAGCLISHDVTIGRACMILNCVKAYGYSEIKNFARIQPDTTISNRVIIGANARVGIGSLVLHDVPDGKTAYGRPAKVQTPKGTTTKITPEYRTRQRRKAAQKKNMTRRRR